MARGTQPRRHDVAARFRLTPREHEILGLLAQGLGTWAISERLEISTKTVSTHIQRLLVKLHVHSRTEAVALAYRERLLEPAPAVRSYPALLGVRVGRARGDPLPRRSASV